MVLAILGMHLGRSLSNTLTIQIQSAHSSFECRVSAEDIRLQGLCFGSPQVLERCALQSSLAGGKTRSEQHSAISLEGSFAGPKASMTKK